MKKTILILFVFCSIAYSYSQSNATFKNITEAQNGFIGINTKTPDAMLTVKGTIHTQEVVIDLEGAVAPDYVFEKFFTGTSILNPAYEFLSLSEIEQFIEEHLHLPKIPSAKEIDQNGLSLKEMNLLLLEKIEELTLHTIAQQKQIDTLSKRIETLEHE
ncbi:MAG: hypothetical protein NXH73_01965 [Flavobacteriaceae bacterium]|nr:hypothetical protein [Flavobacteriaceae bacterium]